jgi:hypothetical protein
MSDYCECKRKDKVVGGNAEDGFFCLTCNKNIEPQDPPEDKPELEEETLENLE